MEMSIPGFDNIKETLRMFNLNEEDLTLLRNSAEPLKDYIPDMLEKFYEWMAMLPEYEEYFNKQNILNRVKKLQAVYWTEFFDAVLDESYLKSRFRVGRVHADINLSVRTYCAGVSYSQNLWTEHISNSNMKNKVEVITVLNKLILLDTAIVTAAFSHSMNEIIAEQSRSLVELSTPTIQLWEEILILPVIGIIDSKRVQEMTDIMLQKIIDTESKIVIMDIQGVPAIDSSVANHLIKITKATSLMGCECILSGISPIIAQTLVQIGADLSGISTTATLKDSFKEALLKLGATLGKKNSDE
jgi:rsbT co-antagonist protein RsbR